MKIAVIEDSKKIGYIIFKAFEREQIDVELFETLEEANKIPENHYSAYIVDYNLKYGEGVDFIKKVRERGEDTPILMLTVRDDLEDKLKAFKLGADDYLTKPFELAELVARIKALIKRTGNIQSEKVKINKITFDFNKMIISFGGKKIPFSKKEYQIIKYLIHNRGHILEKDQILDNVWIHSDEKDPNIVNVYINRIRNKIKEAGASDFIENVRGFGYIVK